jgi:hypothetical protein
MPATWIGGTIGNPNAYGVGTNWSGGVVPPINDTITFSGSIDCDVGASNRTVAGVTFSGYTGVLILTSNLICNGSLTMQSDQQSRTSGAGVFIIGGLTSTITPNSGNWGSNLQLGNVGTTQLTIANGFSVVGTLTFSSNVNLIGSFNISALGNVVASTGCVITTSNTAATTLIIAGASSQWSGSGRLGCNITFQNAVANFVLSGDLNFGVLPNAAFQNPTMVRTGSLSFTASSSTLGIIGNCTMSMGSVTLGNVNFRTNGASSTYTITLNENLNIGGNLITGIDGNGSHVIERTGSNTIQLQGNLTIGLAGAVSSLSSSNTNGGKIVILGKVASTATLSGSVGAFHTNWCNVDIDIQAGANNVTFNTTAGAFFNFGNSSTLNSKTLKYLSGNLIIASTTLNLGQAIIDFPTLQPLNNVNVAGLSGAAGTLQIVNDLTILGNFQQGSTPFTGPAGYGTTTISPASGSTATQLIISGNLFIGTTAFNGTFGSIKFRMVGDGSTRTISSTSACANNIEFVSNTYVIGNFIFGRTTAGVVPTMTYIGGSVSANGTITSYNANYDIGNVQLNNLTTVFINNFSTVISIKASNIFRLNGNYLNGGGTTINVDPSTPNAQMDVYGNVTLGSASLGNLFGNISLYMKGTGTLTQGTGGGLLGVNTFLQGANSPSTGVTIGNVLFGNSKTMEYVSGVLTNTDTSKITISVNGTIKSNGQTFCDIAINGNSFLTINGDLTCRDLITNATAGTGVQINGLGFTIFVLRNLTLNAFGTLATVQTISKIVMTGTGTWTGVQPCGINLDLNAVGSTITILNVVGFTSGRTLKWYAGTSLITTGSTLNLSGGTLDLGNQQWGNLSASGICFLSSDANFNNVTFSGATGMPLSGNVSPRTLTIRGNYSLSLTAGQVGIQAGTQEVTLAFDGNGSWAQNTGTITNLNVSLVSGARTLVGTIIWAGAGATKSFIRTGGTIVGNLSTFIVNASAIFDVPKASAGNFHNITMPANSTITLNSQLGIANNLVLSTTAANTTTFASSGTFGWDTANFTHGGGNTTCILNAGSTYNVSGTFTMLGSNDTTRATIRSSKIASFSTATANGTTLTSAGVGGSPVEIGMELSEASVVASGGFAAIYPNRPILTSASGSPFTLDALYPVTPSTGPVNMEAGVKANFNLAIGTGVSLVLYVTTKDLDSSGGQTIYAFQSYLDAPSNPQANMFRTINWNTLAPPVSPIGIGYLSVT